EIRPTLTPLRASASSQQDPSGVAQELSATSTPVRSSISTSPRQQQDQQQPRDPQIQRDLHLHQQQLQQDMNHH
ncbi:unnamed protein product, partial [Adineta steineri]